MPSERTVKVYVTARPGRYLPTYGQRDYGEYFDLPSEVAEALLARPGFSKSDPNATPATKPAPRPAGISSSEAPRKSDTKTEIDDNDSSD